MTANPLSIPPPLPAKPATVAHAGPASFRYAAAQDLVSGDAAIGYLAQPNPRVSARDYHSLAEMAVESADGRQIVELGWTVDRGLFGDSRAHLFTFHWVDGLPTCYDLICPGFVTQAGDAVPGETVPVTMSPARFEIRHREGAWWLRYQDRWVGSFPDQLWSGGGVDFQRFGLVQWFGEVAVSGSFQTQMGDGKLGTQAGSALIDQMGVQSPGDDAWTPAAAQPYVSNPACYDVGAFTGSAFRFGGPGC